MLGGHEHRHGVQATPRGNSAQIVPHGVTIGPRDIQMTGHTGSPPQESGHITQI